MDERVLVMPAYIGACIGNERHAATSERFGAYETEAFFDAWQDEDVGRLHEGRDVGAVAEDMHAWIVKEARQALLICRKELTGDQKGAVMRSSRLSPCFQCVVKAFPDSSDADKKDGDPATAGTRLGRWSVNRFVVAVDMPDELLARRTLLHKRPNNE